MSFKNTKISNQQLLLLEGLKGIGPAAIEAVLTYLQRGIEFPHTDAGVLKILKEVKKTYGRLTLPTLEAVSNARKKSEQIMLDSENNGISIISFLDETYPAILRSLPNKPLLLHYIGNLEALRFPTVAIVGTREPSAFTIKHGKELAETFSKAGLTIVSGLAVGCDTIAHKAAVEIDQPTVAVMAGGLHTIYPAENTGLATTIVEQGGLLISECPFGKNPVKSSYKLRNRIQTGLSLGVVVLETNTSGGTMHTVGYAQEQKKPLACMYPTTEELESHTPAKGNKQLIENKHAQKLDSQEAVDQFITKLKISFK